ncbi:MAG: hypothetical protein QM820_64845 [Minicystis sp.]
MSLYSQLALAFFVGGPVVGLLVIGAVSAIQVRHVVLGAWASTGGVLPRPKRRLAHEREEEDMPPPRSRTTTLHSR